MLNNSSRTISISRTLRNAMLCVAYTVALYCLSLQDAKAAVPFLSAAEAADAPAPADSSFSVESFLSSNDYHKDQSNAPKAAELCPQKCIIKRS